MNNKKITVFGLNLNTECSDFIDIKIDSNIYDVQPLSSTDNHKSDSFFECLYNLNYSQNKILTYKLTYCPLDMLKPNYNNGISYQSSIDSFVESDYLILIIGNDFFADTSKENVIKKLKRKCSHILNPYFSAYSDSHNGAMMPIMFVICASNDIRKNFDNDSLHEIISQSFDSIYNEQVIKYILYSDYSQKSGMKIPILIGYNQIFIKEINDMKVQLDIQENQMQMQINDQQEFINMHNDRIFKILSKNKAKEASLKITSLQTDIQKSQQAYLSAPIWKQHDNLKGIIAKEIKENYNCLVSGFEQELQYQEAPAAESMSLSTLIVILVILFIAGLRFTGVSATITLIIFLYYWLTGNYKNGLAASIATMACTHIWGISQYHKTLFFIALISTVIWTAYKIFKKKEK